jgi:serine/threonine protein kinase
MLHTDWSVLYSAKSGWWVIADFGITSYGTTDNLINTSTARGRSGYRAPELFSEPSRGYNKKTDIWSLGCIIFELCTGRKPFKDDWATQRFVQEGSDLAIDFLDWFDQPAVDVYRPLITNMLDPQHDKRQSIADLCQTFCDIISLVSYRNMEDVRGYIRDHELSSCLLGTDVFTKEPFKDYWKRDLNDTAEEGYLLCRFKQLLDSRKGLLGLRHPNTSYILACLVWIYMHIGEAENATRVFEDIAAETENVAHSISVADSRYSRLEKPSISMREIC